MSGPFLAVPRRVEEPVDEALVGVGAVVAMKVEDYFQNGKRSWLRLHEKGGKRHEVPAHHNAEAYVDAYLQAAGIAGDKKAPLFRSVDRERRLTARPSFAVNSWPASRPAGRRPRRVRS